jgi:perosamine synthetase
MESKSRFSKKNMKKKGWRFKGNELHYLRNILNSDFSAGSDATMTERFEKTFSRIHGQKYAIASNSGTSTLHQALLSFGVGHGDEVIIPALTVAMCGFAVWQCGATPVFADVDEKNFLIDPKDIEKKITKKTKAIMVVHLYGLMCDMDPILKIAKKYKLEVLEDCAQCFLAQDHKKRISGTVGSAGSWSLESSKHISTGEGGILTTNNSKFAKIMRKYGTLGFKNITAKNGKVRISRDKFQNPNWERHDQFGYNYRLSEICSAVALAQTEKLNFFVKKRCEAGNAFLDLIRKTKTDLLIPQEIKKNFKHAYYTFACNFNGKKRGISWNSFRKKFIQYGGDGIYAAWKTVNMEPCFAKSRNYGLYSGSLKISNSYGWGDTPVAIKIQKSIMQFTTNQKNKKEINKQISALQKTLAYYENK